MQEILLVQRSWQTGVNEVVIPEKLREFEFKVNSALRDNWRLHTVVPTTIKDAVLPLFVLVRDI